MSTCMYVKFGILVLVWRERGGCLSPFHPNGKINWNIVWQCLLVRAPCILSKQWNCRIFHFCKATDHLIKCLCGVLQLLCVPASEAGQWSMYTPVVECSAGKREARLRWVSERRHVKLRPLWRGWPGEHQVNAHFLLLDRHMGLFAISHNKTVLSSRTFWVAASVPGCHGSWVRESSSEGCHCPSYSVLFVWAQSHPFIFMQGQQTPRFYKELSRLQQHPATVILSPHTVFTIFFHYVFTLLLCAYRALLSFLQPHQVRFLLQNSPASTFFFISESLLSTSINASLFDNAPCT